MVNKDLIIWLDFEAFVFGDIFLTDEQLLLNGWSLILQASFWATLQGVW